jgi:hypothetical protein
LERLILDLKAAGPDHEPMMERSDDDVTYVRYSHSNDPSPDDWHTAALLASAMQLEQLIVFSAQMRGVDQ